ncbi:MAG: hypothetical protein PHY43_15730 [Verrucomicrobiales bacterium]|nr:hypothetical protein [Verrucomicrobiales bacterium]
MKHGNQNLPDNVQALFFACDCFNLGEKELGSRRMKLNRARSGKNISTDERERIRQRLYVSVRTAAQTPIARCTFVTDDIVTSLIETYERLLPHLKTQGVPSADAMWVLAKHVFVPTAYLIVFKKHDLGLGTEFHGDKCWYVPKTEGRRVIKPIQQVLDCWLRVAGFRTAYGVSKKIDSESLRHKIDNWLSGKVTPSKTDLHSLVAKFADEVSWLDDVDAWKARFTLACAAQNMWNKADEYFTPTQSEKLAQAFRDLVKTIRFDDEGVLGETRIFFAARLMQRRLQQDKNWEKVFAAASKSMGKTFPVDASDEEIDEHRNQIFWQMNPGNHFLASIKEMAITDGFLSRTKSSTENRMALEKYIFDFGWRELNLIFNSKLK